MKIVMNKLCTSIEQSKQLIELGIDINTADMCWSIANPDLEVLLAFPFIDADNTHDDKIPAWSLSALIEIINHSKLKGYYVEIDFDGDNGYYVYFNQEWANDDDEDLYAVHTTDLVYACCRIIFTLNEKKLL